jgi:signal transduction histidine kinase
LKPQHLANFRSLDAASFAALMRHLGYASAALFRVDGDMLMQLVSTAEDWPAAVSISLHYSLETSGKGVSGPHGWTRPTLTAELRKHWPKGAILYVPELAVGAQQVVFACVSPPGKRVKLGELSGPLEAAAVRARTWIGGARERESLADNDLRAQLSALSFDLQAAIDHELRTPLASIVGFASMARALDPKKQIGEWQEYWQIIETQTSQALDSIEKLSIALYPDRATNAGDVTEFDAAEAVRRACDVARKQATDLLGGDVAARIHIQFNKHTDDMGRINASPRLFSQALWEVLKNAMTHARGGQVMVSVYTTDRMFVIDIEDDGQGVPSGADELVFLRFYQDLSAAPLRRGKRGLGLGLFLARAITERHLGRLLVVRQQNKSVFRFLWPLAAPGEDTLKQGA